MSRVGSVSVAVVPDAGDFAKKLRAKLVPQAEKLGQQLGKEIGDAIANRTSSGVKDGLSEGGRKAKAEGAKTGDEYGGEFGRLVKTRLEAALKDLPKAQLDANATPLDRKLDEARARLEALSGARIGIDISDNKALAEIEVLQADLRKLSAKSTSIAVRVDAAKAIAELEAVREAAREVDGTSLDINTKPAVKSLQSGRHEMQLWVQAAVALSPALVPLAEGLVGPTLGLVGALSAAGAAAVAFGAVAVPAFMDVANAIDEAQYTGAAAFDNLTASEKTLFAAEQGLKSNWDDINKTLQPIVLPVITRGFDIATAHMKDLIPLVKSGALGFSSFEDETAKAFDGPQWQGFINFVSRQAPPAFSALSKLTYGLAEGFGNIFNAIEPTIPQVDEFITKVGTGFRDYTGSSGFYSFLQHAEADLPLVGRFLESTAKEVGGLVVALEPFGTSLLGGLTTTLDDLSGLNPKLHDLSQSAGDLLHNVQPTIDAMVNLGGLGVLGALNAVATLLDKNVGLSQALLAAWTGYKIAKMITGLSGVQKAMGLIATAGAGGAVKTLGAESSTSTGLVSGLSSVLNPAALATLGLTAAISGGILLWQRHEQAVQADKKAVDDYAKNIQQKTDMLNPDSLTSSIDQLQAYGEGLQQQNAAAVDYHNSLLGKLILGGSPISEDTAITTQYKEYENTVQPIINLNEDVATSLEHLQKVYGASGQGLSDMLTSGGVTTDQIEAYAEAYKELASGQKQVWNLPGVYKGLSFGDIEKDAFAIGKVQDQINASNDAMRNASNPSYQYQQALQNVLQQAGKTVDPIDALNTALTNFQELMTGLTSSSADARSAILAIGTDFTTTGKDGKTAIDLTGVSLKQVFSGDLSNASSKTVSFTQDVIAAGTKMDDLTVAAYKNAIANGHNSDALSDAVKTHDTYKQSLIKELEQMGLTTKEADQLADKYAALPPDIETQVKMVGLDKANDQLATARSTTRGLQQDIDALHDKQLTLTVTIREIGSASAIGAIGHAEGGPILRRAEGGPIRGAGTATSDSIPVMGSDGEYVVRARAVSMYGMDFMDALNQGRLRPTSGGAAPARERAAVSIGTWVAQNNATPDQISDALDVRMRAYGR